MARKFRRQSFASCSKGRSIACACRKTCLSAGKTEHCAVGFMVDVPFGLHRVPREQPWKVRTLDRQECLSVRSSDGASSVGLLMLIAVAYNFLATRNPETIIAV